MASTSCSSLLDGDTSSEMPPEMDKLLPSLPKEPVAECTESTRTPRGRSGIDDPDRKTPKEQEPFCSPAPPPFPFSLSYSSKSESSGERGSTGGEKKRRSTNDGMRDTGRSKMVAVASAPADDSLESSSAPSSTVSSSASAAKKEKVEKKRGDTIHSPVAKHPGERVQDTCVQNDGNVKNPIEDPMYTSLFTNEDDSKKSAAGDNSNIQVDLYGSPNPNQAHAGKVVTEGEDESPVEGGKIDPQLTRYENNKETPSRGTNVASHYFQSTSPDQAYYPYHLSHQHFYETGHGAEDTPQGYPSYPYPESRPSDGNTYGSYSYYQDHASPYNYSPYPGSGYVGNHAEHAYHSYHHGGEQSPGQVSYTSSHSPGTYQSPNHQANHDITGNGQASPYEAMPPIEPSSPPFKKQRSTSSAWSDRFCQLVEYSSAHGDCNVPQKYPENASLGIWVNKQRMEYKLFQEGKKSSMTLERIQQLESIGFTWAKRKGPEAWETKFRELVLYKEEHGDCLVPTKYMKNKALGRWVSTQRAHFKLWDEGKKSTMTDERKERLENIGFIWRLQF